MGSGVAGIAGVGGVCFGLRGIIGGVWGGESAVEGGGHSCSERRFITFLTES